MKRVTPLLILVLLLGLFVSGFFNMTQNFKNQELNFENEEQQNLINYLRLENEALTEQVEADLQTFKEIDAQLADVEEDLALFDEQVAAEKEAVFYDGMGTACVSIYGGTIQMPKVQALTSCAMWLTSAKAYDAYHNNNFLEDLRLFMEQGILQEQAPPPKPARKLPGTNA